MFDRRNFTNNGVGLPVHKFEGHEAPVLCVQVIGAFDPFCLEIFLGLLKLVGI